MKFIISYGSRFSLMFSFSPSQSCCCPCSSLSKGKCGFKLSRFRTISCSALCRFCIDDFCLLSINNMFFQRVLLGMLVHMMNQCYNQYLCGWESRNYLKVAFSFLVRALQALKTSLGLPLRLGWNGDPCVPQQHPWSGADCQFDRTSGRWVIDGL